jgi:peptide methionine sulfoxide reductase msrA/msrB
MKTILTLLSLLILTFQLHSKELRALELNPLNKEETRVMVEKGTERPFSGQYYKHKEDGSYLCKRCNAPLYTSSSKFESSCGWPSFDDAIPGAIKRILDADGRRVEIVCANCGAHLGHVFEGEGLTDKNTRYCVNSISLNFEKESLIKKKKAYFAGGCFWGMEYHFEKLNGVLSVTSGYIGGNVKNPTYKDVSQGNSGHYEAVEIVYDSTKVSYETLAKLFFEIHDPTQKDGQGPDIGSQYLSAVFTSDKSEQETINKLIMQLQSKGLQISTKILNTDTFYKAENYHQDYYKKNGKTPYCHAYVKRF